MTFSEHILKWYGEHKRDLPWRATKDPYKIWLSEIMLQQTRVEQGTPYYYKFIAAFPTVFELSKAKEEQVLKLWQGLGYYSRARNLHATAKTIVDTYNGQFPNTYSELIKLKGVGDYTASAIASICFNEPEPVVDGNVYRALSRYFGIEIPINSSAGIKYFKELAREVMHPANIRDYNQGIMEFGSIQCAPKNPNCGHCPLNLSCAALQKNKVTDLPVKINKTKIKDRYFNYMVFLDVEGNTLLEKRMGKGIWQNLYQFPLLESEKILDLESLKDALCQKKQWPSFQKIVLHNNKPIIHKLSHQHLYTQFWILDSSGILNDGISWSKITSFAVPVLIADFIKTFKI
ncbi:A/G-specific adenine glycosylase [Flagellimonas sp. 2504JD1-5]